MPAPRGRIAVVLVLDTLTSTAIEKLRRNFGLLPPPGSAPRVEPPPHVTLAACSALDLDLFRPVAAELAARAQPLRCTLASIGVFPTAEGVLFLAPTISADLVQLQLTVVERLQEAGGNVEPYWLPGQWVPHCTLAIGIAPETIATAVRHALTEFHQIAGDLVRLSVYAVDPPALCYEFPLGRGAAC